MIQKIRWSLRPYQVRFSFSFWSKSNLLETLFQIIQTYVPLKKCFKRLLFCLKPRLLYVNMADVLQYFRIVLGQYEYAF
jgi:hypothetical protein